ncbi:Ig-like domain-containing protein [Microbacterium sediminis]|uniref:Bacterial Ig-like domain-containing protein n=1 Tax=Microbacterium sediminis TaxID=904291 RepID=A0A1B9NAE5_9MICO|nr:Ig-like domain-containing protein [Microbacterium sediminis]OCG73591.1 hypothetical protein A7J15_07930 [Microbacterium sediminis]
MAGFSSRRNARGASSRIGRRALAVTASVTAASLFVGGTAAVAAVSDESEALGQVVAVDLLTPDLLEASTAWTGYPSDPDEEPTPLNLGALNGITLSLGGGIGLPLISGPGGDGLLDLGELGAVSSYAASPPGNTSTASAGAVTADGAIDLDPADPGIYGQSTINLTDVLAQAGVDGLTDQILDAFSVTLGAIASTATATGDPATGAVDYTSDYMIADAQLALSSPLVAGLTPQVTNAITGVGATLNAALGDGGVIDTTLDGLTTTINGLLGALVAVDSLTLQVNGADAALAGLAEGILDTPLQDEAGLVSIDLRNGDIFVNADQLAFAAYGQGLSDLGPNTELLSASTIGLITGAVTEALGTLTERVTTAVQGVLNNLEVVIDLDTTLSVDLGFLLGGVTEVATVDATITTTLGQLAGTMPGQPTINVASALLPDLDLGAIGALLDTLINPAINGLVGTLTNTVVPLILTTLQPTIAGLLTTIGSGLTTTLNGLIAPVLSTLDPVLSGVLAQVASITINEQETGLDGNLSREGITDSFTVNALSVELLPQLLAGDPAANVDLASSTVRASAVLPAPVITTPANGSVTSDVTPTISGTGYEGATVTVTTSGGQELGTAVVQPDGGWSFDTAALPDGTYTITATQTLGTETSEASAPVTFTIDTVAPEAPVITTPDEGDLLADNTPTIAGTAPDDAVSVDVSVQPVDGSGAPVGDPIVLADVPVTDGAWTIDSSELPDGDYVATATAFDAAGNDSEPSAPVGFSVDATAPAAPVITSPEEGDLTSDNTPTIAGTAPDDAVSVEVSIQPVDDTGAPVGDPIVLTGLPVTDGAWTIESSELTDGDYVVTATAFDEAGNESAPSEPVGFTVDATAPDAPAITAPADGSSTNAATVTITGTAPADATSVTVVLANPDGTTTTFASVPVTDGAWSVDAGALAEGAYSAVATAFDAAGNDSEPSTPADFTVDRTATAAPVITAPEDGTSTNAETVTIEGTAPAGAVTVTVVLTNPDLSTTTLADVPVTGGVWSVDAGALGEGTYSAVATAFDAADNESEPSEAVGFTVDRTATAAPVITAPEDGSSTNAETITIEGTAPAGATSVTVVLTNPDGTSTTLDDVPVTGGTWSVDAGALGEGAHSAVATAFDAADNESEPSEAVGFTVDRTATAAPVITAPEDGSSTNAGTVTIAGTAPAGATSVTVVLTNPGGTTTTFADVPVTGGTWSVDAGALGEGAYSAVATAFDAADNESGPSEAVGFTVDRTAPGAPEITSPEEGDLVTATPTIEGTGEEGATIQVVVSDAGGNEYTYTTVVGAGGSWSVPVTDELVDGPATAEATQTDAGGNVSPADTVGFTVDTVAPIVAITAPIEGESLTDVTPTIEGTVDDPDATVYVVITDDADEVVFQGTAVVTGGTWSIDAATLSDGEYAVTASAMDLAGNTSTDEGAFVIDTTGPALAITEPTPGELTNDSTPTIAGTVSEPETVVSVVVVIRDVVTGGVAWEGPAEVGPEGTWTVDAAALPDGEYEVSATATDADTNTSTAGPVAFTLDATPPAPPTVTEPDPGETVGPTPTFEGECEDGATVIITINGGTPVEVPCEDGTWTYTPETPLPDGPATVEVIQEDEAGNPSGPTTVDFVVDATAPAAPAITAPAPGAVVGDDTPTIVGTGEIGATVEVTIDGEVVGTTVVGPGGTWTFTPTTPLDDGPHTVTATQADAFGNESPASAPVGFTVDTSEAAPVITSPESGTATNGTTPTIEGTGTPGSTVTVTDQGGTVIGTDVVDEDGTWSVTPDQPLDEGTHTFTATQEDALGNVSPESNPVIITVDSVAPAAPVITSPADGDEVTDPTPVIEGTGEPGATVEVVITDEDGNETSYETVVGSDGTWSVTPTAPLGQGQHTIVATQTDPAGNVSPASDPVVIDVVVVEPGEGDAPLRIWIREPVVERGQEQHGIGYGFEPGETVTVTVHSTPHVLGTFTADANGELHATWVIPADEELGLHHLVMEGAVSGSVDIEFRVVEASAAGAGGLPATGVDAGATATIALLVLMLGAGLMLTTRRLRAGQERD